MLTLTQLKISRNMKILQRSLLHQIALFCWPRAVYAIASLIIGFAIQCQMQILHHRHELLT